MALSKYDITYVSRNTIKGSALAEHLAYHPLADPQPLCHEFLNEHIMATSEVEPQYEEEWTMWFDGASNVLGNGIGVVLASPRDQYFPFSAKLGFDYANNMAKYEACTMGLIMALEHQVKRLRVYGDSALEIIGAFDDITFHHVPREENQIADALATLSAMVQYLDRATVEADLEPWYSDIKKYLEKGEYPKGASKNSKRTLRRLANGYLLSVTVLYKRNTDMTLLRYVDRREAEQNNRGSPCGNLRHTCKWSRSSS
ncbi:hypothetical protein CR513_54328, partial [Mucuna pruriens]